MEPGLELSLFNKNKPFYPLILNYLTFYLGFKFMSERAVALAARENYGELFRALTLSGRSLSIDVMPCREPSPFDVGIWATPEWRAKVAGLKPGAGYANAVTAAPFEFPEPLRLRAEVIDDAFIVDADLIARHHKDDRRLSAAQLNHSAGSLLILAYEMTKQFHDKGPLWEFLRHCRNAAAHNGLFTFHSGEPKRQARWRQFEIQAGMEGSALIDPLEGRSLMSPASVGLLGPGDPILLLWDIEQAYPNLTMPIP